MQTIKLIDGKVRELYPIKHPIYTEDGSAAFRIDNHMSGSATIVRYDLEYKHWATPQYGIMYIPVRRYHGELIGFVDAEVSIYTTRKVIIVNPSNIELERYYKNLSKKC
jgi:hypothetical protein